MEGVVELLVLVLVLERRGCWLCVDCKLSRVVLRAAAGLVMVVVAAGL